MTARSKGNKKGVSKYKLVNQSAFFFMKTLYYSFLVSLCCFEKKQETMKISSKDNNKEF